MDAHAKPPIAIRDTYKKFQKLDSAALVDHFEILDRNGQENRVAEEFEGDDLVNLPRDIRQIFLNFLNDLGSRDGKIETVGSYEHRGVFKVSAMPGLYVYPSLLPAQVQCNLLDKLLHRDLSNPQHKTNVHMHYNVPYPPKGSYFDAEFSSLHFNPKDPDIHKPLTAHQYLDKKLRWMTLGGQYDWTNKVYPSSPPPPFPADVKTLIEGVFPMKAEAAIVNLYSPGDTLSLHRDVSEECAQPLVSISLGCDGIFIAGLQVGREKSGGDGDERVRVAVMRLRSGDAVLMSGESRYAWHGVPKVLAGTCPEWMRDWPGLDSDGQEDGRFREWKGWMSGKRVNVNVRQMFA